VILWWGPGSGALLWLAGSIEGIDRDVAVSRRCVLVCGRRVGSATPPGRVAEPARLVGQFTAPPSGDQQAVLAASAACGHGSHAGQYR